MPRTIVEPYSMERTTIVTSKFLIERVGTHVKQTGDNQTNFLTKAIVNQLEREGDIDIRDELSDLGIKVGCKTVRRV